MQEFLIINMNYIIKYLNKQNNIKLKLMNIEQNYQENTNYKIVKIFLNLKCKNEYDHLKKFLIKLKLIMLSIERKSLKLRKFFGYFQIITTNLDNKYI